MSAAARWLESAAVAVACALFAVTAGAPVLGGTLALLALATALPARRLALGTNVQLLLGALALGAAWWLGTVRAAEGPAGSDRLNPLVIGGALFLLAFAVGRLPLASPYGGRRATAAPLFLAVVACGGALHGPVYPVLAAVYGVLQLAALSALDSGRPAWDAMTRRVIIALGVALAIAAGVLATGAAGLPPLHDASLAALVRAFGGARTGFGLQLQLGSLRGLIASDTLALRVHGPKPELLRGVVFDRYTKGTWLTSVALRRVPVTATALPPDAPDVTRIVPVGGDRDRYFAPLDAAAVSAPEITLRADPLGVLLPPDGARSGPLLLRLGPRTAAPVAPPSVADRALPEELRAPLETIVRALGLPGRPPEAQLALLAAHFQREFRYSLEFARVGRGDPVLEFLTERREGHCEYFASAAALLLRAAGLPARVVGGYRVTERNPVGGYHVVRESNAHAWVEVWLDGPAGAPGAWRTFDPTPSSPLSAHMAAESAFVPALVDAVAAWMGALLARLPEPTATEWVLFGVGPLLAVFIFVRWRAARRSRTAKRTTTGAYGAPLPSLVALLAALAAAGAPRRPDEPLETYAERVRSAPELAEAGPRAAALLASYAAWRYGGSGAADALARQMADFVAERATGGVDTRGPRRSA